MKLIKSYLLLIFLLFLASINFNLLIKPFNLICGGTNGVATIFKYFIKLDYYYIILIINLLMFFLSICFLKKKATIGFIISTFIYPFFVFLTRNIYINLNFSIIIVLLAGIISGITNGLIYKLGFNMGGISIIGPILNKYLHIPIFLTHFFINFLIIIFSYFLFGFNNFLMSIIILILNSFFNYLILKERKNNTSF